MSGVIVIGIMLLIIAGCYAYRWYTNRKPNYTAYVMGELHKGRNLHTRFIDQLPDPPDDWKPSDTTCLTYSRAYGAYPMSDLKKKEVRREMFRIETELNEQQALTYLEQKQWEAAWEKVYWGVPEHDEP